MAKARWQRDQERRAKLDALDPIRVGGRIVVIRDECRVKERTIFEHDRPCDVARERREVFA